MKRQFLLILIFVTIQAAVVASNADTALVEHTSLGRLPMLESMRNPALHGRGYQTPFSQLELGIDVQHQSEAFVPEKGTGYILPYLKVNTYHPLSQRSTVWGEASYMTGTEVKVDGEELIIVRQSDILAIVE